MNSLIIGAGLMGRWHARAITRAGGRVVGVVDSDTERGARLASQCRSRAFGGIADALAVGTPGVAHICTPLPSHVPLIRSALAGGWHVVAEKPLASSADETRELFAAAAAAQRLLVPVHQFLFQRGMLALSARLASMGEIIHVEAATASAGAEHVGPDGRDAIAAEILPHFLALTQRVTGADVAPLPWSVLRPRDGEWRVTASSARTSVGYNVSMSARPTFAEFRVFGTRASARLDLFHGFALFESGTVSRTAKITRPFGVASRSFAIAAMNIAGRAWRGESAYPGLNALVERVYDAVRTGRTPPISPESALDVAVARDHLIRLASAR